jgi:hypothetical protein
MIGYIVAFTGLACFIRFMGLPPTSRPLWTSADVPRGIAYFLAGVVYQFGLLVLGYFSMGWTVVGCWVGGGLIGGIFPPSFWFFFVVISSGLLIAGI